MRFLIYGAYGYTGDLLAREAAARGWRPVLSGRDPQRLAALAGELGLEHHAASLDDAGALDALLGDVPLVLHAAGPFRVTARPMVEACLRTGTHYLDITGEADVFEALAALDGPAREAGVLLLPGVGFDVVPSDGLAAYLKAELPSATRLELAFRGLGGVSRGTARTALGQLGHGGLVRRGGRLKPVPAAWTSRQVDFGSGPREVVSIPWGDVATAWRSTGIPDITVYTQLPAAVRRLMGAERFLKPLLQSGPVQRGLEAWVARQPPGPDAEARARGRSQLWGEVSDAAGRRVQARLEGPEGYTLTVQAALAVAERVVNGLGAVGYQTPSTALGADFVLGLDGVHRQRVEPVA